MSLEYSLCIVTVYVPRQLMSLSTYFMVPVSIVQEYSLICPHGVQFMFPKYSLCPQEYSLYPLTVQLCPYGTVYVPRVQFMSPKYTLCPWSTIYVPRGQFMSPEFSLCPKVHLCPRVQFMSLEYSLCSQSTVYVLGVLFMSIEYYLCPLRIVYVPRIEFMFQEYSLCPYSTV